MMQGLYCLSLSQNYWMDKNRGQQIAVLDFFAYYHKYLHVFYQFKNKLLEN